MSLAVGVHTHDEAEGMLFFEDVQIVDSPIKKYVAFRQRAVSNLRDFEPTVRPIFHVRREPAWAVKHLVLRIGWNLPRITTSESETGDSPARVTGILDVQVDSRSVAFLIREISRRSTRDVSAVHLASVRQLAFVGEPDSPCEPPDSDGRYGREGDAVVIKGFKDMPADDQNKVIAGAVFVAGMGVFLAYICIQGRKK